MPLLRLAVNNRGRSKMEQRLSRQFYFTAGGSSLVEIVDTTKIAPRVLVDFV